MSKLFIDFETRSRVDLKKCGAWAYARHHSTEVLCMAYSFDGQPPRILTRDHFGFTSRHPWILEHRDFSKIGFSAHNAAFEYAIYHEVMVQKWGWPPIEDPARWDCTLARAAMCNLPISLDACGAALEIKAKKDLQGRAVMMKLCKPQADGTFNEDPELLKSLYLYCQRDVEAEIEIDARLPQMPPKEKEIWGLDLLINKRGVRMDVQMARNAAGMVGVLTDKLNVELNRLTGGSVSKASRVQEMKRYLATQGVIVESLDKQSVTTLLADPKTPAHVKDVLNIRRQVGKTSTAKYQAILDVAGGPDNDGRARGLLQYHGAATGRWAGRMIQIHNFPKGLGAAEQAVVIEKILKGDVAAFTDDYRGKTLDVLSGALRGTMIADDNEELIVADYSTIEPRVLFWLAGETEALEAYRLGADLYVELARTIFRDSAITNIPKYAKERAVGKFGVLGCGYGMGAPRFQAQCAAAQPPVQIDIDLAGVVVRAYRDKYSKVPKLWKEVEAAAKKAVMNPGLVVPCAAGRVHFGMDKKREFLICRLPNGKHLRYFKPTLVPSEYGYELHYQGPGVGGVLEDQKTYGGSLVENVVQAIAREILAAAMLRLEAAGYDTLFHVHDEMVSRFLSAMGHSLKEFIDIMCQTPSWAPGLPLKAEGWIGRRYRK